MRPENLPKYLSAIEQKIIKAQAHAKKLEHARNTSDGKMQSRYDTQREIFATELSIQQGVMDNLNSFKAFLETLPGRGPLQRDKITLGAEFSFDLWDVRETIPNALYAPTSVGLEGVQIITPQSPIGAAIEGMVAGNTFVYKLSNKPGAEWLAGVIKRID